MRQADDRWTSAHTAALEHTWGEYRVWAATARQQKADLWTWRRRVLVLTILGAVLGALSYQLEHQDSQDERWQDLAAALGLVAGIAVGLAAFFTRELLGADRERGWVRARSVAEALKSECYLLRVGVSPYSAADAPDLLLTKIQEVEGLARDVPQATLASEQRSERLPTGPLSEQDYVQERVDDQIDGFYIRRSQEYEAVLRWGRAASVALGAAAIVLGAVSATGWTTGWIAALATLTAAITGYLYAGRYQYLVVSYQATAAQLRTLKTQWQILVDRGGDAAQRGRVIRDFESEPAY